MMGNRPEIGANWTACRSLVVLLVGSLLCNGCTIVGTQNLGVNGNEIPLTELPTPLLDQNGQILNPTGPPAELTKVSHPTYRLEPPDVVFINAIRMVPRHPYELQTRDILQIVVANTFPDQPIAGPYEVEPSGMVTLGPGYGSVKVAGLTLLEATERIREHLSRELTAADVSISLLEISGRQQVVGEHLVGPDGTVNLGIFGGVYVAGMTVDEARGAIEAYLSKWLDEPEVSVQIVAYQSKFYYIVTEGAGLMGDRLVRVPVTGNETVLDAIATMGGLNQVSSKKIWISRPSPGGSECDQLLPVDWQAIAKGASTATNYQILPGDRVFIAEDRLMALDAKISKLTRPFERLMGTTLLTTQTLQFANRFPRGFSSIQ